uniref:Uncharacterized protein n=1 Tax=Knipowitschia caucasica TaxID=637954 RepID=A0AAV2MCK3_KNICA
MGCEEFEQIPGTGMPKEGSDLEPLAWLRGQRPTVDYRLQTELNARLPLNYGRSSGVTRSALVRCCARLLDPQFYFRLLKSSDRHGAVDCVTHFFVQGMD